MTKAHKAFYSLFIVLAMLFVSLSTAFAADKLPAEKAGELGQPDGRIAFIRDGNIWVMNVAASEIQMLTEVTNADGRLSWSPDGRQVLFTRNGLLDMRGPDLLGGKHKLYDLFVAFMDSMEVGNKQWWYRVTSDLGSRDPEWGPDGKIIFWKDLNANQANAAMPNYQLCTMDGIDGNVEILRKDWQLMEEAEEFFIAPSRSPDGKIAFVHFFQKKPQGIAVLDETNLMESVEKVKVMAMRNRNLVSPCFSPDGKWIAYINNDLNDAGLYIATPDFSERYLVFSPPVSTYMNTYTPSWSPNSKWLTFSTTDGSIWVSDITGMGARRLTPPGLDKAPTWSKQ
ncbi:MAG: hypothetical protein P1R58_01825 [bacterium]|nr:hypothetical protein [bacterium]